MIIILQLFKKVESCATQEYIFLNLLLMIADSGERWVGVHVEIISGGVILQNLGLIINPGLTMTIWKIFLQEKCLEVRSIILKTFSQ